MPTRDITLFYPRSGDQSQRFRKHPDIVGGMVLRKLVYIVNSSRVKHAHTIQLFRQHTICPHDPNKARVQHSTHFSPTHTQSHPCNHNHNRQPKCTHQCTRAIQHQHSRREYNHGSPNRPSNRVSSHQPGIIPTPFLAPDVCSTGRPCRSERTCRGSHRGVAV